MSADNIRKQDIIIELGSEWVRVGLIGDRSPRKTIKAGNLATYKDDASVEQALYYIFYSALNTSCLNKSIIILQRVFTDRIILQSMAKTLFLRFKVQRIQFHLCAITPLYLTGRFSGLVVSGGASTVEIMPAFESYPLMQYFQSIPVGGGQSILKTIKDELMLNNPEAKPEVFQYINEQMLTDLRNLHSNMSAVEKKSEQTVTVTVKKNKLKLRIASINYNNLFGDAENEQYNIADSFLKCISNIPQQMLSQVCGNVIFAGGLWRVKGMQNYFKKRILEYLPKYKKLQALGVKEKLKFVNWNFNPSEVSWIGCSVGASVRPVESLCLKRMEYETNGFSQKIMQNYFNSKF